MHSFFRKEVEHMTKATNLNEMQCRFIPFALEEHNFDDYYVDVSKARGVDVSKRITYRFKSSTPNIKRILLLGHSGSGKTTELYRVSQKLSEDYLVVRYSILEETDVVNFNYIDFIFTVLNNVFLVAQNNSINVSEDILENLYNYWNDEQLIDICDQERLSADFSLQAKASWLTVLTGKIKGILQTGTETKKTIRRKIEPSLRTLLQSINDLVCSINEQISPKKLLLIVEDLDKLEIPQSEDLFVLHRKTITSIEVDSIFTFPIFLYYSSYYNEIINDFDADELLSMVKVKNRDGSPYEEGRKIIKEIVWRRCETNLIAEDALDFMIEKSGGSFRDLFTMISNAALNADIEESTDTISLIDAKEGYKLLKNRKERAVLKEHIDLLKEIHHDKTKKPLGDADNILIKLLHSMSIIEYNGERWCDLHPAVEDYLIEKGEINAH